jgi:hypothetical protein
LDSLSLTVCTTPFLFASVPPVGSTLPPSSKQAAQKNETHLSVKGAPGLDRSTFGRYTLCNRCRHRCRHRLQ